MVPTLSLNRKIRRSSRAFTLVISISDSLGSLYVRIRDRRGISITLLLFACTLILDISKTTALLLRLIIWGALDECSY